MNLLLAVSLWGSLVPGPHPVGFQTSMMQRGSRPLLMAVWYPSSSSKVGRMRYEEYFRLPTSLGARLGIAFKDVLAETWNSDTAELLGTPTYAVRDAVPAPGRFPLVIYHAGAAGSYEDNSSLLEYLASYGYVVVSSAYQSSNSKLLNNIGGPDRSMRDMRHLIEAARKLPFVDGSHAAGMGHSYGAQILMQWMGEKHCPLAAAVILDTTLEYTADDYKGHLAVRTRIRRSKPPHIPVLLCASAERKPRFGTWMPYLQFARREECQTKHLGHNDYTTHGARRPGSSPETNAEYDALCLRIREFLDSSIQSRE